MFKKLDYRDIIYICQKLSLTKKSMNINKKAKLNLNKMQLSNLLRITDPFLMIDEVKNIIPGKSGDGYKYLKKNNWFYKCHFVNEPIMPETLQIESMLQTIVSVIYSDVSLKTRNCLVIKSSANFYSKVNKTGKLKISAEITKKIKGAIQAKASIYFYNKIVANGVFRFIIPENLKI